MNKIVFAAAAAAVLLPATAKAEDNSVVQVRSRCMITALEHLGRIPSIAIVRADYGQRQGAVFVGHIEFTVANLKQSVSYACKAGGIRQNGDIVVNVALNFKE